jgi:hypothetical protein
MQVIWVGREWEYFLTEDWTTQIALMGLVFLSSRRMVAAAFQSVHGERIERHKCHAWICWGLAKQAPRQLLRLGQGTRQTMRSIKPSFLIIFVISLSIVMAVVRNLRIAGFLTMEMQLVVAYVALGLNFAAAIAGFWTRLRLAWVAYLVLSIVSVLFLSSMPISAAWILTKLAVRHAFA